MNKNDLNPLIGIIFKPFTNYDVLLISDYCNKLDYTVDIQQHIAEISNGYSKEYLVSMNGEVVCVQRIIGTHVEYVKMWSNFYLLKYIIPKMSKEEITLQLKRLFCGIVSTDNKLNYEQRRV